MIKQKVINELIKKGIIKPYFVINHSYTDNGERDLNRLIIAKDNISPCLTTRPDTLGMGIMATKIKQNEDLQVVDYRYDEGIRGRVEHDIVPTLTTKSNSMSGKPMVLARERE